jgi:hypothetical protein
MTKEIIIPAAWYPTDDFSSHRPMLYMALESTGDKPITEFGIGFGSTPLIEKYSKKHNRHFFCYENLPEWANRFECCTLCGDYLKIELSEDPWRQGVLFIDCAPGERRKDLITKHANHADIIVVHDTEPGAEYVYHMSEALSQFKYRCDLVIEGMPQTTAVSNVYDLSAWKGVYNDKFNFI